jgi:ABC-type transport system involved in multi-copper enzyme maturation permease subunit
MSGFIPFLRKELGETVRTWRLWVLPGFLLFSAVSSPLVTYLMPTLLDQLGTAQQGLSITVSDPTALQAYLEFLGNLTELTLFALVIAYGGIVSGEVRSGTAALTLAKPLSRAAFITGKWLSQAIVVVAGAALATLISISLTQLLFGDGPATRMTLAVALWTAYALMLLAAMVLLSVELRAPAAASGAGVGVYAALLVLAQFEITSRVTPAGLPAAALAVVQGEPAHWASPLAAAVAVAVACILTAIFRFRRREI